MVYNIIVHEKMTTEMLPHVNNSEELQTWSHFIFGPFTQLYSLLAKKTMEQSTASLVHNNTNTTVVIHDFSKK